MYERQKWDKLRSIATLAVILIHVSSMFIISPNNSLSIEYLFFNQLSRFAVPAFLVASGFGLVASKKYELNYLSFIKSRFKKILPIYIIASIIYYIISNGFQSLLTFKGLLIVISGKSSYQLYYIPILIFFYIFFHSIYKLLAKRPEIVLIFSFLIQMLSQLLGILGIITRSEYNPLNWIFFFVFGMFLSLKHTKVNRNMIIVFTLLTFICQLINSVYLYNSTLNISLATTTLNPITTIFSIFIILSILTSQFSFININSSNSLLIYIVHPLILSILSKLILGNNILAFVLLLSLTIIVSILTAKILKLIFEKIDSMFKAR